MRFNSDYIAEWRQHSSHRSNLAQQLLMKPWREYTQTRLDKKASKFGLHSWIDPISDSALVPPVFWKLLPTHHINLSSQSLGRDDMTLNELLALVTTRNGDISGLALLSGDLILRVKLPDYVFQLQIKNGKTHVDPRMYINSNLSPLLVTIINFLQPHSPDTGPPQNRQTRIDPQGLLLIVEMMDQGHSQKEIAIAYYGEALVESEWHGANSLRHALLYHIRVAQKIVDGDYKDYVSGKKSFSIRKKNPEKK